jgi:hypothetical protein
MRINHLYTYLKANINFVIPIGLVFAVIIFGGIGVYVVEHNRPGANISTLGNALWWAVITITTVGCGDYTPITPIGRVIAVAVMFSGIGIVVSLVTLLSQRRLQHTESMLTVFAVPYLRHLRPPTHVQDVELFITLSLDFVAAVVLNLYSVQSDKFSLHHAITGLDNINNNTAHIIC